MSAASGPRDARLLLAAAGEPAAEWALGTLVDGSDADLVAVEAIMTPVSEPVPVPSAWTAAAAARAVGLRPAVGPVHLLMLLMQRGVAPDGADPVPATVAPVAVVAVPTSAPDEVLARAHVALDAWSAAVRPRRVLLAGPRSFCAGVERAIDVVERVLARFEHPVYVRRQVVHNTHVVADLEAAGAIFVEELDEVPDGATVVLAAHGVSPEVRDDAARRGLRVIDATCPLVAKVHGEARRFAQRGYDIVLIGHADHEEVVGTMGEAPEAIHVVAEPGEVDDLQIADPDKVAYLTQTTLAVDETADVVNRLRARFPGIVGPATDDICYATQNRQEAVRAVAREADVVLVVGSANSSNSNRLVEVAEREGVPAYLLDDHTHLELAWIRDASTVGITAGASAPESLVEQLTATIGGLGPIEVIERTFVAEDVHFRLPVEVR